MFKQVMDLGSRQRVSSTKETDHGLGFSAIFFDFFWSWALHSPKTLKPNRESENLNPNPTPTPPSGTFLQPQPNSISNENEYGFRV